MGNVRLEDLPRYTYADYRHWEGRWELINGVAYAMSPAPSLLHQRVSQRIAVELERALQDCDACQALLPVDWKIADDTVVQPDNLVVCGELSGAYLTRPPRVIFEVLSPSTEYKDRTTKFRLYEQEAVSYYAIVNPAEQQVKVYRLRDDGRYIKIRDTGDETVEFDLGACRIMFEVAAIWC